VKEDSRQEPFERQKLLRGLVRACSKRDVAAERLEALVIDIEHGLRARHIKHVTSDELGGLALDGLAEIDEVAYVRFASVYRAFEDANEFQQELDRIRKVGGTAGVATDAEWANTHMKTTAAR
jgi:transcriptional repressor NrdR